MGNACQPGDIRQLRSEMRRFRSCVNKLRSRNFTIEQTVALVRAGGIDREWLTPTAMHAGLLVEVMIAVEKSLSPYRCYECAEYETFREKYTYLKSRFGLPADVLCTGDNSFTARAVRDGYAPLLRHLRDLGVPKSRVCDLLIDQGISRHRYEIVRIFGIDKDPEYAEEFRAIVAVTGVVDGAPSKYDRRVCRGLLGRGEYETVRAVVRRAASKELTLDVVAASLEHNGGFAMELVREHELGREEVSAAVASVPPSIISDDFNAWLATI